MSARPIILSFNAQDPTGGAGISADALTSASLEANAFTIPTALLTGDFSQLGAVCPLDADWIDDQARTLLEDSVIQAIKVGVVPDVDIVRVIAEIISDYPDVPVILAPSILVADDDPEGDSEEIITAIHQLLIPNAHVLVAQKPLLKQLAEIRHDFSNIQAQDLPHAHARALASLGCEFVLITDAQAPSSEIIHELYDVDGLLRSDAMTRLPYSFLGANTTLSAAIATLVAHGQPTPQAVGEALEYTWQTLKHGINMGMGKKIPDRFYWTRPEGEASSTLDQKVDPVGGKRPTPSPTTLQ